MRILLTGRNGQVGHELARSLAPLGEVVAFDRAGLDLARTDQIVQRIREVKPQIIVNPAAYTAVDKAESDRDAALAINATAPGVLAEEAKKLGALLVHYSTDYVFDGTRREPYTEDDAPHPIGVYGASKLAGERAIQASGCRHLILRTSWVYGLHGHNFLLTMLRLAKERPALGVVDDQHGAPTWSRTIADTTAALLQRDEPLEGLFHLTATGTTTWCGFAREIMRVAGLNVPVHAITTSDYPTPAKRPAWSMLSTERLRTTSGIALPRWDEALRACLAPAASPPSA